MVEVNKEVSVMAKTKEGKKIIPVREHTRTKPGGTRKTVPVKPYRRSTPE